MSRIIIVVAAVFLTVLQIYQTSSTPIDKKGKLSKESVEIRSGDCAKAVEGDLLYEKDIDLPAIPLLYRKIEEKWFGDGMIYCIMALTTRDRNEGSNVTITAGGLKHNYVTFELRSQLNHGLGYHLQVYGTRPRSIRLNKH